MQFTTPILLLVFNRPDYVQKQLELLKSLRATHIYIASDNARLSSPSEKLAVVKVRRLVKETHFDRPVKTLFHKKNLGCKYAVSTAITWFFSKVGEGIILEDDCFPDQSFFPFCAELLKKYQKNKRVWQVGGASFLPETEISESYFFSTHPHGWGWATWRDRWQNYDPEILDWPIHKEQIISLFPSQRSKKYWQTILEKMYLRQIDTWDYQWIYTIWKHDGLSIVPAKNLVKNIGFDKRATHTKLSLSPFAYRPIHTIRFPLQHPQLVLANRELDQKIQSSFEESIVKKSIRGALQKLWMIQ